LSYELRIQGAPTYLHVVVTGNNTPDVVRSYLREVQQLCANRGCTALLIEENLDGPGMPVGEIYGIVSESSDYPIARLLKVAFVNLNMEHSTSNVRFAETVARNRGVNIRAFRNVQDAQAWLTGGDV
jgi:hypothetical protein